MGSDQTSWDEGFMLRGAVANGEGSRWVRVLDEVSLNQKERKEKRS